MINKRVKIKDVIESQLPRFVLEDNPKFADFLRQYYISQEFQGGAIDLAENLDQYIKLDNLVDNVINPDIILERECTSTDTEIVLSNSEGLPDEYGLIKIDDEIITYTERDNNTLKDCIRGFSGISKYRDENNPEELIFESTDAAAHTSGVVVFDTTGYTAADYFYQSATITKMFGIIRVRARGTSGRSTPTTFRLGITNIDNDFYQLSNANRDVNTNDLTTLGIDSLGLNQTIIIDEGDTIEFIVNAQGFPLWIQSTGDGYDTTTVLTTGVTNGGASTTTTVQNLSVEFLKEYYIKLKELYAPGFEDRTLSSGINVGNFLKNTNSFYKTKGTRESFRILFNVLYGKKVQVVDLEDFVVKSSTSDYLRRAIVVVSAISGNPLLLTGQTLYQDADPTNPDVQVASGPISEVEIFTRQGEEFYKIPLFVGFNEQSLVSGEFFVPGFTKNTLLASANTRVINVDSTVGFSRSGSFFIDSLGITVTYTDKNLTQFLGCSGLTSDLPVGSEVRSTVIAYGYEDGDSTKKVEMRITGVLGEFEAQGSNYYLDVGNEIYIKSIGENIAPPVDPLTLPTYKQRIFNSWIYNIATRFEIDEITGSTVSISDTFTKSNLRTGDSVDILARGTNTITTTSVVTVINNNTLQLSNTTGITTDRNWDLRRVISRASSSNNLIEFGNQTIISNIQNAYVTKDKVNESMYVATQGLPSFTFSVDRVFVDFRGQDVGIGQIDQLVSFQQNLPFVTGDEIVYEALSGSTPLEGLVSGTRYFIWVNPAANNQLKLANARSFIEVSKFIDLKTGTGTHRLTLASQYGKHIQPQKILRQFPLKPSVSSGLAQTTTYGPTGMLINGIEILNYKSNDYLYYGPLQSVELVSGGTDYDVINPPKVTVSNPGVGGTVAVINPVLSGSLKSLYLENRESYDIDQVFGINIEGGNGEGASGEITLSQDYTEANFNAKDILANGGVDIPGNTLTFIGPHNFKTGQKIVYNSNGNQPLGVALTLGSDDITQYDPESTLQNGVTYFANVVNITTIKLHETEDDANAGVSTVGITTFNTLGIHKFRSFDFKNKIQNISVVTEGSGYTKRTYEIKTTGISTGTNCFLVKNHGFQNNEDVIYQATNSIPELTTDTNYRVIRISADEFRLALSETDVTRGRYIFLSDVGSGIHTVKYPDVTATVVASIGGTTVSIPCEPDVRGEIIGAYLSEPGSDYGSKVLNFEKPPLITVSSGSGAQFQPLISNGIITQVQIIGAGSNYTSAPDLTVVGPTGSGAQLKAKLNATGKVATVEVISGGIGYDAEDTAIVVRSVGQSGIIESTVRPLTVNLHEKYSTDDFLNAETQYPIQYASLAYSTDLQTDFGDTLAQRSPIIGWAYDGNPIFGPFATRDPKQNIGITTYVRSGYQLASHLVPNRPDPGEYPAGFFVEDYKFMGTGDLDVHNGRWFVSDDFPDGIYGYVATLEIDPGTGLPRASFPYYIGDTYIAPKASQSISQDDDINALNLSRNTYPYRLKSNSASYDFVIEADELIGQEGVIDSVFTGGVEQLEIVEAGDLYKVGDPLLFDEEGTNGNGVSALVSFIKGKEVNDLQSTNVQFDEVTFQKTGDVEITGIIQPNHDFNNGEVIEIFNTNTDIKGLQGFHVVGVASERAILLDPVKAGAVGVVTDLIVSRIPANVSGGSSIKFSDGEVAKVLNVIESKNLLRIERTGIASFSASGTISYLQDRFTIASDAPQFVSEFFPKKFFNPKQTVGVGTTVGNYETLNYTENNIAQTRVVEHGSIFLNKHPFLDGQKALFVKKSGQLSLGVATAIGVGTTATLVTDSLPRSGVEQEVYIVYKSINTIGIKTEKNGAELFFTSDGSDDDGYFVQGIGTAVRGSVLQPTTTVTTTQAHGLKVGDTVNFNVIANQEVGLGASSRVRIELNNEGLIIVDSQGISSAGVNTSTNRISIPGNNFRTGDRVYYEPRSEVIGGLGTGRYYVYRDSPDNFRLCETYEDSVADVPVIVSLTSIGGTSHNFGLINPKVEIPSRSTAVFDLQNYELNGYDFKIYYDQGFNSEFVGTGQSTSAEVGDVLDAEDRVISIGNTYARLDVNNNIFCPKVLYYNVTKDGKPLIPDNDVKENNTIKYVDSAYTGNFAITGIGTSTAGIGTTTFSFAIAKTPEQVSYAATEGRRFYSTAAVGPEGPIDKINLLSSGEFYTKLPRFLGVDSVNGDNSTIKPKSTRIGQINSIQLVNEGFNYSSDTTLRPIVDVPTVTTIRDFNTVGSISILSNGKNYISAPKLELVDRFVGTKVDGANIVARINENSGSIVDTEIAANPVGLQNREYRLYSVNNTNGIVITKSEANPTRSGIVTFTISTPVLGFSAPPFKVNDEVWIEGFEKDSGADGYNSSDHFYNFLKVSNVVTTNPFSFEVDYSNYTFNVGLGVSDTQNFSRVIPKEELPTFNVVLKQSSFDKNEKLLVNSASTDLQVISFDATAENIKFVGTSPIVPDDIIIGAKSGSQAKVVEILRFDGVYSVKAETDKTIEGTSESGKLNSSAQVIQDNNYYQNLSYTLKTEVSYEECIDAVNNSIHPTGLKNFVDNQLVTIGKDAGINTSTTAINATVDLVEEVRVDDQYYFDIGRDVNIATRSEVELSNEIELENAKLSDYFESITNRVLNIDDISSQFSNISNPNTLDLFENIYRYPFNFISNRFLVQITSEDRRDFQVSEITILQDGTNTYYTEPTFKKLHSTPQEIGTLEGSVDTENSQVRLRFFPADPFATNYDIKVLNQFYNTEPTLTGIGTTAFGFAVLMGSDAEIGPSTFKSFVSVAATNFDYLHSQVEVETVSSGQKETMFVELKALHDDNDSYMSEYNIILSDGSFGGTNAGAFGTFGTTYDPGNNNFSIEFYNARPGEFVNLKARTLGFGNTTGTTNRDYRFLATGMIPDNERSAQYYTEYQTVGVGSTANFAGIKSDIQSVNQCTMVVGYGRTVSAFQYMFLNDQLGDSLYFSEYPVLSIGNTTGLGTVFAKYDGEKAVLVFTPDAGINDKMFMRTFNEVLYLELERNTVNPLEYGAVVEETFNTTYTGLNFRNIFEFPMLWNGYPIFSKTFNPANTSTLNLATGQFTIKNHFFATGQELEYIPGGTFVGVVTAPMTLANGSPLPSPVYAIKDNEDQFRIGLTTAAAIAGIGTTLGSVGAGNLHEFDTTGKLSRSLIAIDGLVQKPLTWAPITRTLENNTTLSAGGVLGLGKTSTFMAISGISSVVLGDIFEINDEFVLVEAVGVGTTNTEIDTAGIGTFNLCKIQRGSVGTAASFHPNGSIIQKYTGSYSFARNNIFFTGAPNGGKSSDEASTTGIPEAGSSFNGRVYLRKNYDSNKIFDDISGQFTGVAKTFTLKSEGKDITGIGSEGGFGIFFVNNMFQKPQTPNNFNANLFIRESGGQSDLTFTGILNESGDPIVSATDINQNGLPRGGVVVTLGSSEGKGFANLGNPSIGASINHAGEVYKILTAPTTQGMSSITNYVYDHTIGLSTVTTSTAHGLEPGDSIDFVGIGFTCVPTKSGITTGVFPYTRGQKKTVIDFLYDNKTGMATVTTLERFGILEVGEEVFFNGIGFTCIGQKFAQISQKAGITTTLFPCRAGIAKTISAFNYDNQSGIATITLATPHRYEEGERLFIENLNLKCGYGADVTNALYDAPTGLTTITTATPHKFSKGDKVRLQGLEFSCAGYGITFAISAFEYNNSTGITTITTPSPHGVLPGEQIKLTGLGFTCPKVNVGTPIGFTYEPSTGLSTVTFASNHGLTNGDKISIGASSIVFTCTLDGGATTHPYPRPTDFAYNKYLPISGVTTNSFQVNVGTGGTGTFPHTFVSATTNAIKTLNYLGVTTSTFPDGTQGNQFRVTKVLSPTKILTNVGITSIPHVYTEGGEIQVGVTSHIYPTGKYGFEFIVSSTPTRNKFRVNVGPSTIAHTYVSGGTALLGLSTTIYPSSQSGIGHSITDFIYDNTTGLSTITVARNAMPFALGDRVNFAGLGFTCPSGFAGLTSTIFPQSLGRKYNIGTVFYNNATGLATVTTTAAHDFKVTDSLDLQNLLFNCSSSYAGVTTHRFPDYVDEPNRSFRVLRIVDQNTIWVDVGVSTIVHTYNLGRHTWVGGTASAAVQSGGNYVHTFLSAVANGVQSDVGNLPNPITNVAYTPNTGNMVITSANHLLTTSNTLTIADNALSFTCTMDGNTATKTYPRSTDPVSGQIITITGTTTNTITINVGASPIVNHDVTDATYDNDTGVLVLTIGAHSLNAGTSVKIANGALSFTCEDDGNATTKTYPRPSDPYYDTAINIESVGADTITLNVGINTRGTVSAIKRTGPYEVTRILPPRPYDVTNAIYDPVVGIMTVTIGEGHGISVGETVDIGTNALTFTCDMDSTGSQKTYPRNLIKTFTATNAIYDPVVGVTTITVPGHGMDDGCWVKLADESLSFICGYGVTDHTFISATTGAVNVQSGAESGNEKTPNAATYNASTGLLTLGFAAAHGMSTSDTITLDFNSLTFTCAADYHATTHTYPRVTDPIAGVTTAVTVTSGTEFTINVGDSLGSKSAKSYPRSSDPISGQWIQVSNTTTDTFEIQSLSDNATPSTNIDAHTFTSAVTGGITHKVDKSFEQPVSVVGVGNTTIDLQVGRSPIVNFNVTDATYEPTTGVMELTIGSHAFVVGQHIKLADNSISFTCTLDGNTVAKSYPRASGTGINAGTPDYAYQKSLEITAVTSTTITVNVNSSVGLSSISDLSAHTFDSATAGAVIAGGNYAHTFVGVATGAITKGGPRFNCNVGITTYKHIYTPSIGVGEVRKQNFGGVDDTFIVTGIVSKKSFTIDAGISTYTHFYDVDTKNAISKKKLRTDSFIVDTVYSDRSFRTNVGISSYRHVYDPKPSKEPGGISSITGMQYNTTTGIATFTVPNHGAIGGELISISGLALTCPGGTGITTHIFPDPNGLSRDISTATYNNFTGIMTVTTNVGHGVTFVGQFVKLENLGFACTGGAGGSHTFVSAATSAVQTGGNYAHTFVPQYGLTPDTALYDPVTGIMTVTNQQLTVSDAIYDPVSGEMTLTVGVHRLTNYDSVRLDKESISFSCVFEGKLETKAYPRSNGNDYAYDVDLPIIRYTSDTITVNVNGGKGAISHAVPHTFIGATSKGVKVNHGLRNGDYIKFDDYSVTFTCNKDGNATLHPYPRPGDPLSGTFTQVTVIDENKFSVGVLTVTPSTNVSPHTFVSAVPGGIKKEVIISGGDHPHTFVGTATSAIQSGGNYVHTFLSAVANSVTSNVGNLPNPVTNVVYTPSSGDMVITSAAHLLTGSNTISIADNGLSFTCTMDGNTATKTYPRSTDPISGIATAITGTTTDTFTINVGASPIVNHDVTDATYDAATGVMVLTIGAHTLRTGTSVKIANGSLPFTCTMDGNTSTKNYPRSTDPFYDTAVSIAATTSDTITLNVGKSPILPFDVSAATYDAATGIMVANIGPHTLKTGTSVKINEKSLLFTCSQDDNATVHAYPRSTIASLTATTGTVYDPVVGIMTITTPAAHGLKNGDEVKFDDGAVSFSCQYGVGSAHTWAGGTVTDAVTITVGPVQTKHDVTNATYDPATGVMVFTIGAHSFTTDDLVEIGAEKFAFTCTADGNVKTKYYPRATDPAYNTPLLITAVDQAGGTITVNVGATSGTVATAYPRSTDFISNRWIEVSNVTTKTFDVQVLDVIPSTNTDAHTFVSGVTNGISFKRAKDPYYNTSVAIAATTSDTISLNVGVSTIVNYNVSDASYDPNSGKMVLTIGSHDLDVGTSIKIADNSLTFTCDKDNNATQHSYPRTLIETKTVTDATYDPTTGMMVLTVPNHGFENGRQIKLADNSLSFTCTLDGNTSVKTYPRATDPVSGKWIKVENVTTNTFEVQTLATVPSTNVSVHTFVSATDEGLSHKRDPFYDNNINIEARTPTTITVNIGATPDLQQSTGLTGPTYFTDVPITGFNYTNTTGVTTITAVGHGLTTGENVKLSGIALTCTSGMKTYPDGGTGFFFGVTDIIDANTFVTNTGISTIVHTYVSGGNVRTGVTSDKFPNPQGAFNKIANFEYNNMTGLATVTTNGFNQLGTGQLINFENIHFTCPSSGITSTVFPQDTGIAVNISNFQYDNQSGIATVTTATNHNFVRFKKVRLQGMTVSCAYGTKTYPDKQTDFELTTIVNSTTFVTNVGVSTLAHTYVSGGTAAEVKNAGPYTVKERIDRNTFTVNVGVSTYVHIYDHSGRVSPVRYTGPYEVLAITNSREYTINVGRSPIAHTYTGGGTSKPQQYTGPYKIIAAPDANTLKVRVGISTYQHFYGSGGMIARLRSGIAEKKLNPGPFRVKEVYSATEFTTDVGICTFKHFYHSGGKVGKVNQFFPGSGFYGNSVPVTVVPENGVGSGLTVTTRVGFGGSLVPSLDNVGTGFTIAPRLETPGPSYDDLPVRGLFRLGIGETTATGIGLSVTLNVGGISTSGVASETSGVKNFTIGNRGYGFQINDIVSPIGLVTAAKVLAGSKTVGYTTETEPFELQVVDTFSDTFYGWQFGQLDYIDDITPLQDGVTKRFPLFQNEQLVSFEKADGTPISFPSLLIIFINGVLQIPDKDYIFEGGTAFEFTSPPQEADQVTIYFYRGSNDDVNTVNVVESIKIGDELILIKPVGVSTVPDQNPRVVNDIVASDILATNLYSLQGIDNNFKRPVVWRKQKVDRTVDGRIIPKTREALEPQIYPTARVIGSASSTQDFLFLDNASLFNYENVTPSTNFDGIITQGEEPVVGILSVGIGTTGASAGTISTITVLNGGSGYTGIVTISISNPPDITVGFGTTALATAIVSNGSIIGANITNAGSGYGTSAYAIVPNPIVKIEPITLTPTVNGYEGEIIGITTTTGIGTDLSLKFTLNLPPSPSDTLRDGMRIFVNDTFVGSGLTSIDTHNSQVIGIGTTACNNIYKVHQVQYDAGNGIITAFCNIDSNSNVSGINTVGFAFTSVGYYSWGIVTGFSRGSNPIALNVDGNTFSVGLGSYPLFQRRGFGLRGTGGITK